MVTTNCNPVPIDLKGLFEGPPTKLNNDGKSITARLIVDCRCLLGECCLYDERQNSIVFTNILERKFHKLNLYVGGENENKLQSFDVPKMLCAFGLLERNATNNSESPGYIVAWEDGFQLYDIENNKPMSEMSEGEIVNREGLPDRLNDGRVDFTGKFFICGGCASDSNKPLKVYKCEYDTETKMLQHTPIVDQIRTTNSICWSNDGKTMYITDSPTKQIVQYDYDIETGTISNKRLLHKKQIGDPDGSVVDAQGYIWNATWCAGKCTGMVERIDPNTGQVVFTVFLPDETSEASCCCFGGPNLNILFITTAYENLDPTKEPHAGGLYAVKLPEGMSGCSEKRFKTY